MVTTHAIALADPPDIGALKAIHAAGAADYGIPAAIVSGGPTYARASAAVLAELGDPGSRGGCAPAGA